jgi:acyl-CoA synthetase (AMP-forming)/AMP-acid ligase II
MLAANDQAFVSLGHRIRAHARATPQQRAFVCDGQAIDYATLLERAEACAGRLQAAGHAPGGERRVGVLSANHPDFAVVITAGQLAGITVVPLPGLITAEAQARMLRDANIVTLFHDHDHAEKAATAARIAGGVTLVPIGPDSAAGIGALDRWLDGAPRFDPVTVQPDWASDFIYSSGTTGIPKGIVQSYAARTGSAIALSRIGYGEGLVLLHTVGLYSNFGIIGFMLTAWWGGTFFTMRKFSADYCIRVLSEERVDSCWVAPATLLRILAHRDFAAVAPNAPCIKLCAGAPLSATHKQLVRDSWPGDFYDLYGQTETGTITLHAIHAAPAEKLSSVGTLLPSATVCILDDDGNALPAGAEGEIAAYTSTMMTGYHAREDAEAAVYWDDGEGRRFVRTGDVGKLDEDGFLWLCDRKKDMIISGGYNVFPADIERIFQDHPAVFEVAVVGFPSAKWGESPVAFVTVRDGQSADAGELETWVNARLASVQRVAAVKIVAVLPNGSMGKILKRELRETYQGEVGTLP